MKRMGGLWPTLTSADNLYLAARRAARGKRAKPGVARFLYDLELEIPRLRRELSDGSYQPGPYRSFLVRDPKPRLISAAPFRDRVVHHALTQVLEPIFERRFSARSYACRVGFGAHRALEEAARGFRSCAWVLKCDIRKYFASINHALLLEQLGRVIKCRETLALCARIIAHADPQEEELCYFPGDNLFTPAARRRGLPLGNQTSQFFANVYLDPLDQFVQRELKPAGFVRYVDDFLVFARSKPEGRSLLTAIERKLEKLRLRMHPGKSRVYRTADGVPFLGWRLFPTHRRLDRGNWIRFRRRARELQGAYAAGEMDWPEVQSRLMAWNAHASHGDTWRLRERLYDELVFRRGNAV